MNQDDKERFWEKVDKTSKNECWQWEAATRNGYGAIKINGSTFSSHRISYKIHNDKLHKDKMVLHKCDNRKCVNPNHLYEGTRSDNTKDCIQRTDFHPSQNNNKGEKNKDAKIKEEEVKEIRNKYEEGKTQQQIADEYPITRRQVGYIVNKEKWKHIK